MFSYSSTSGLMRSGLSKFFAQMTNAFPPFTSWSGKQLFLNPSDLDQFHTNSNSLFHKHAPQPSTRQFVLSYLWLAIRYSLAHLGLY
jgi:hypothetical protein